MSDFFLAKYSFSLNAASFLNYLVLVLGIRVT